MPATTPQDPRVTALSGALAAFDDLHRRLGTLRQDLTLALPGAARVPAMDLLDAGDAYRVLLDVPGAVKEELEIGPGPAPATVSVKAGGKARDEDGRRLWSERGPIAGPVRYERVVALGRDADVAKASPSLEDGVLTLVVPKRAQDQT